MKTIREAIDKGAKTVYCNNGLTIELPDLHCRLDECMFSPKMIQGKPVFIWVFVSLHGKNREGVDISAIEHRCMFIDDGYCYFHKNDYLAKEREINELISDNGGIDEYRTTYWIDGWMYV